MNAVGLGVVARSMVDYTEGSGKLVDFVKELLDTGYWIPRPSIGC